MFQSVVITMSYIIAIIVALLDQYTKALAIAKLKDGVGSVQVFGDVLRFTYVENTGAAFGIFQNGNVVLTVITAIILAGVLGAFIAMKPKSTLARSAAGLIMGGAVGNLIDRVTRGFVVDFLDVRVINYPVFNIADSCVVVGAALICIYVIFSDEAKAKEKGKADEV